MANYDYERIKELEKKLKELSNSYDQICDQREMEYERARDLIQKIKKEKQDLAHENELLKVRNAQLERALKDALSASASAPVPVPTPAPTQTSHVTFGETKVVKESKRTPLIGVVAILGSHLTNMRYPSKLAAFLRDGLFLNNNECTVEPITVQLNFDGSLVNESVLALKKYDLVLIPDFNPNSRMVMKQPDAYPLTDIKQFEKCSPNTLRIFVELTTNEQTRLLQTQEQEMHQDILFFENTNSGIHVCEMSQVMQNSKTFYSLLRTIRKI